MRQAHQQTARFEASLLDFFVPKISKTAQELKQREREARRAQKLASKGASRLGSPPLPPAKDVRNVFSPGPARDEGSSEAASSSHAFGGSELKHISKIARERQRRARGSATWGSYGGAHSVHGGGGLPVYSENAFKTIDHSACLIGD